MIVSTDRDQSTQPVTLKRLAWTTDDTMITIGAPCYIEPNANLFTVHVWYAV